MKRIYIIFLLAIAFSLNGFCGSFSIPHDVPTVEALIDLHKTMAKYEEQSKKQEISSTQSNAHHTKVAQKWHDVRDTINSKLDVANQWIGIATTASRTSLDILKLTKEYVEFTRFMTKEIGHKPFVAWYYSEANYEVYKRVKFVKKSIATIVSAETNILKASMSERAEMIWNVDLEVQQIRDIINNAMFWMKCCVYSYIHIDYIWEILNSDVIDGIADDVASKWQHDLAKFGVL